MNSARNAEVTSRTALTDDPGRSLGQKTPVEARLTNAFTVADHSTGVTLTDSESGERTRVIVLNRYTQQTQPMSKKPAKPLVFLELPAIQLQEKSDHFKLPQDEFQRIMSAS